MAARSIEMPNKPAAQHSNARTPSSMLLEGLVFRRIRVAAHDVVFVKGVIDASEGLAVVFAESGGELTLATSVSQVGLLDEVIADLTCDVGALLEGS